MNEIWRPITGYEGLYEVSNAGRILALPRSHRYARKTKKILFITPGKNGYPVAHLCVNGKARSCSVHILVLTVFVGPRPQGYWGCHNDGNKMNNRVENLRWDTPQNNMKDCVLHGTAPIGEHNPSAKLTEQQAKAIRADDRPQHVIAMEYGVTQPNISTIKQLRSWKHIS